MDVRMCGLVLLGYQQQYESSAGPDKNSAHCRRNRKILDRA